MDTEQHFEPVPAIDIKPLMQKIADGALARIAAIYRSGEFSQGAHVLALEAGCRKLLGVEHAVACSNGTTALHLACLLEGVGPGHNVIVPANTFVATGFAPLYCGARVRLADIDPETLNIDPRSVGRLVDDDTRLIIAVDFCGNPADFDELSSLGPRILLDGAHSHGARLSGASTFAHADLSTTSFFPSKVLGSNGEGGAVFPATAEQDALARQLRRFGEVEKHRHDRIGYNYKMMEIVAAHLLELLETTDSVFRSRSAIARIYDSEIHWDTDRIRRQGTTPAGVHGNYLYPVVLHDASQMSSFRTFMANAGILLGESTYKRTLNRHAAWPEPVDRYPVPIAEDLVQRVVSLPIWFGMPAESTARVVARVNAFLKS